MVFRVDDIENLAKEIRSFTNRYETLFDNFGVQIFSDVVEKDDLLEQLETAYSLTQTSYSSFERFFPSGINLACNKGCSHCCSFPIEVPLQVVIDIFRHIQKNYNEKEKQELILKLKKDVENRKTPLTRSVCPFLNEENACSIYDKRPLSCRWFTSQDASLCEKSVQDESPIPQHPVLYRLYQHAATALMDTLEQKGYKRQQLLFTPSLLEILTTDEENFVNKQKKL